VIVLKPVQINKQIFSLYEFFYKIYKLWIGFTPVHRIFQVPTKFLQISSTTHLRIIPHLLEWQDPESEFYAVIQLGTLQAVMFFTGINVVSLSRV